MTQQENRQLLPLFFYNFYLLSNINYALCAESVRKYMIKYEYTLQ